MLLHTDTFTHRHFYTQTLLTKSLLHTGAFTHRSIYTQTLLHTKTFTHSHTEAFTHRRFDTQALLHTNAFTYKHFYTQTLLHIDAFTRKSFYTQTLLHTEALTHKRFYTQTVLHTRRFYTQSLLHTDAFTHRPAHVPAVTVKSSLSWPPQQFDGGVKFVPCIWWTCIQYSTGYRSITHTALVAIQVAKLKIIQYSTSCSQIVLQGPELPPTRSGTDAFQ